MQYFFYYLKINIVLPYRYYVLAAVLFICISVIARFVTKSSARAAAIGFLISYVMLVYSSLVINRPFYGIRDYNFLPGWSYIAIADGEIDLISENILNVIMLMPIGLLVPIAISLKDKALIKVIIIGAVLSTTFELSQLIFMRGLCEFDDVFHNTLGCVIGYLIYLIIDKIRRHFNGPNEQ